MARPILDRAPTVDDPGGTGPEPRLPPPPTTLPGGLGAKWRALGGTRWGTPAFRAETVPGGQWVQFVMTDASQVSMFSSAAGAFLVGDRINQCWRRLDRHRGYLGFPTSDELGASSGGRYQRFQGGMIVWHPKVGAFEVHGEILDRYNALGGSVFGYPTTDESSTPDGVGRFNHFRNVDSGADLSIYWTPQTKAVEIYGLIRQKWATMGWERSPLGYPIRGETTTGDVAGRFSTFQGGGYIVYHPNVGTFATFGPISQRYTELGGARWAYPTTDVTNLRAGGQYLHLRNLTSGDDRSIYWHPSTGAHEVFGQIRVKWAALGWERSHLGFPTGPEQPWTGPSRQPGGRVQDFQGGQIFYDPKHGTWASPVTWSKRIDAGGFKGDVHITASADGTVTLRGYVRSSALAGFKYVVQAMLISDNRKVVAFSKRGEVSGTHGTDEKDELRGQIHSDVVRNNFHRFANGTMQLDHHHDNTITGALGDLIEGILTWSAGTLVITPGVGLVLVAATELVSLATSGSLVPGARIIGGTLWLAGPAGMMFALAAEGLTQLATEEREISDQEYDFANLVFKNTLPPKSDIRISNALGGFGRAFTFPRFDRKIVLNFGPDWEHPIQSYTEEKTVEGQLFIHELTHAWQYRNNPSYLEYAVDGLAGQLKTFAPGEQYTEPWSSYNIEQQATIVDRWYATYYSGTADNDHGLARSAAMKDHGWRYIRDHIRTGRS